MNADEFSMTQPATGTAAEPEAPSTQTAPRGGPSPSLAQRQQPLSSSSRATAATQPRLYAPLFSLLNPIEDSSVATSSAAAPQLVDNQQPLASPHDAAAHVAATHDDGDDDAEDESSAAASAPLLSSRPPTADPAAARPTAAEPVVPPSSCHQGCWGFLCDVARDVWWRCARDVLPVDQPSCLTATEREKMSRYESVDSHEPESMLYKDHLETRSHEPRWFMWVFVLVLGLGTSALSLGMMACLHVLNAVRYELLGFGLRGFSFADGRRYPDAAGSTNYDVWAMLRGHNVGLYGIAPPLSYGSGYLMWVLCAVGASALASGVCFLVPESVGSGIPEVKAYLNGVDYPMMRSTRVLAAKLVAVVLTVGSGVCTGHFGLLMLAGAMLGAQLLQRRHGLHCYHVHFVDCFRNPRDRRVILIIGAAAGIASAFCVSVGGLLVVLELLSAVLPVRFALYVFAACLLSTLATQVYLSYWVNFDTRYRPTGTLHSGELLAEAVVLFRSHLPFGQHPAMNLMDFVVAAVIGLAAGAAAVVFVRLSWAALYVRRRLEVALGTKAIRYVLPILFTLVYVSVHYGVAVAFTYGQTHGAAAPDASDSSGSRGSPTEYAGVANTRHTTPAAVCRPVPYAVRSGRNVTTIAFYGMNGFFCSAGPMSDALVEGQSQQQQCAGDREAAAVGEDGGGEWGVREGEQSVRVIDAYASLAFSYADSTLQTLLSQRTASLLPWRALATFTVLYFFSSAVYSGLALCGDTLLPSLVIGAALGRCVGSLVHTAAVQCSSDGTGAAAAASSSSSSWADPGVFALFGAGSFVSATSGLSFGIGAILIESTADFRHLLPLMLSILVARRVLARWGRDVLTVYLEARAVPLLNAHGYLERFALLDAGHVMHRPVVALPVVCSLDDMARVLRTTTHHGFPVVSAHDGTCKGIVTRAQLEVLLWHLVLSQGRVSHCTYDVLQRVEDHVFHNRWEGRDPLDFIPPERLRTTQISLYPHVDTSAFTVLDTTALSGTYEMFTTLGLRHLVVVDRLNYAVGMITRKDLTGDHLSAVQARLARRDTAFGAAATVVSGGDGDGAHTSAFATLRAPLHPTAAQVAAVARASSTRRLHQHRQHWGDGAAGGSGGGGSVEPQLTRASFAHHGEGYCAQTLQRVSLLQLPVRTEAT